jgi:hypothetical protein
MIDVILAGAFGSLVKDIVEDGHLVLPKCEGDEVILGFIGGIIVGAFIGFVVNGDLISASMGGYVGSSILKNLVFQNPPDI